MRRSLTLALVALAWVLAACGDGGSDGEPTPAKPPETSAEIPVVEITKADEGFEAPDSIPGGLTRIRVHNAGTQQQSVHFLRFTGDGTLAELNAAYRLGATDFAASAAEIYRLTYHVGGTGNIAPGGMSEVVFDLMPGRYVMRRFLVGSLDSRELEVTAAPDARPAPPESAFTVRMLEFAYDGFPDTLPAGTTEVEVVNDGALFHLMFVQRVNEEGITAEQVTQHLNGTPLPVAPSYSAAGGMGEMEPGASGWVTLDLDPGVYALICIIFDRRDDAIGELHVDLGMHHAFTVE